MGSHDQRQERIKAAMGRFQRFPGDTGSSEVQGEMLCPKISPLTCDACSFTKGYAGEKALLKHNLLCLRSRHSDGENLCHG
jgi:ribosomal protein S15P/S13E